MEIDILKLPGVSKLPSHKGFVLLFLMWFFTLGTEKDAN
jgi:hypothetical protein